MTCLQTKIQTSHNLQTDEQMNVYLFLTTTYAPELVSLDCSFTLMLRDLITQHGTDRSSR